MSRSTTGPLGPMGPMGPMSDPFATSYISHGPASGQMPHWPGGDVSGAFAPPLEGMRHYLVTFVLTMWQQATPQQQHWYVEHLLQRMRGERYARAPQGINYEQMPHTFHVVRTIPNPAQRVAIQREILYRGSDEDLRGDILDAYAQMSSIVFLEFHDAAIATLG